MHIYISYFALKTLIDFYVLLCFSGAINAISQFFPLPPVFASSFKFSRSFLVSVLYDWLNILLNYPLASKADLCGSSLESPFEFILMTHLK